MNDDGDDIPEVSLVEIAGFSFDVTVEEDRILLAVCLDALVEVDRREVTKRAAFRAACDKGEDNGSQR